MKYTTKFLFVAIAVAAILVGLRSRKLEETAAIHVTSETTSYRWSFKQKELNGAPYWSEDMDSSPPLGLGDIRRIAEKIANQLAVFSNDEEIDGWTYGSILSTKIERGYSDERRRWAYVIEFSPSVRGTHFGRDSFDDVIVMVLMNGKCFVSDDSWRNQEIQLFLAEERHGE